MDNEHIVGCIGCLAKMDKIKELENILRIIKEEHSAFLKGLKKRDQQTINQLSDEVITEGVITIEDKNAIRVDGQLLTGILAIKGITKGAYCGAKSEQKCKIIIHKCKESK